MKRAWLLMLSLPLALLRAQDPEPRDDALTRAHAALLDRLRAVPETRPEERSQLLAEFLRRFPDDSRREVALVRLQLASCKLHQMQFAAAAEQFTTVAAGAAGKLPLLHAWALYGLHQAKYLAGDKDGARQALTDLIAAHDGTARADAARVALARLDRKRDLRVGEPLPELRLGRDVHGRELPRPPQGGMRLLVFFSLAHEPSRSRLGELASTWQRLGQPASAITAFALEEDLVALRRLCDQRQWEFPVLPGQHGFLHPDWLELDVTAVPAAFLVGGDGTLLARDLSADRLATFLRTGQ